MRCYQVIDDPASDKLYLVLEFAAGGQIVHWQPEKGSYAAGDTGLPLTETVARSYMRDIILGLEYLHQSNVAHRDMKPENLLVTADGRCKITDFGVSKMFDEGSNGFVTDTEGTHAYFSPESCSGKEYSAYMDDVWGLGVCLYAMVRMRRERACVCVCVCVCVLAKGYLRSRHDKSRLTIEGSPSQHRYCSTACVQNTNSYWSLTPPFALPYSPTPPPLFALPYPADGWQSAVLRQGNIDLV